MSSQKEKNKLRSSQNDTGKSQLSSHPTGARNFSTPDDIAKGGGSVLYDDDFGTLAQSERRDKERAELNRQRHMMMKKEHAVRVGYRRAIKKRDGAGALALLKEAEGQGLNPFGLRREGERNKAAYDAIASKRASEIRGGRRKYEPNRDQFQMGLIPPTGRTADTPPPGTADTPPPGTAGTTPPGTAPPGTAGRGIGDYASDSIAGITRPLNEPPGSAPGDSKSKENEEKSKSTFSVTPELSSFVEENMAKDAARFEKDPEKKRNLVNNPDRSDSNDLFKDDSALLRALSSVMGKDTRSDLAAYFKSLGDGLEEHTALRIMDKLYNEGVIVQGGVPDSWDGSHRRAGDLDSLIKEIEAADGESFLKYGHGFGISGNQDNNKEKRLLLRQKLANMSDMSKARNVTSDGVERSAGEKLEQAFEMLGIDPDKGFQVMADRRERNDQATLGYRGLISDLVGLHPDRKKFSEDDLVEKAGDNLSGAINDALYKRIDNAGIGEANLSSNDPRLKPLSGSDREDLLNVVRENIHGSKRFHDMGASNPSHLLHRSLFDVLGMDHVKGSEMLLKMAQDKIKEQEAAERNRTIL